MIDTQKCKTGEEIIPTPLNPPPWTLPLEPSPLAVHEQNDILLVSELAPSVVPSMASVWASNNYAGAADDHLQIFKDLD